MTTVDGVHCCRRWLTVTVRSPDNGNMFLFRKQQSSKLMSRACCKPICEIHCKITLSSHKVRIGDPHPALLTPSSHLLWQYVVSCESFFNGRASSQFTVHSYAHYNTTRERSEKRRSSLKFGYAGPGSASLGMSPHRHGCDFGQILACQHTAQKWLKQLHRLFRELMSTITLS